MLRFFCCFFSLYIFFTFSSQADFFQTCGLNSEDLSNIDYVLKNGIEKIEVHANDLIIKSIGADYPKNDGKQTPMKNHPVFIAQHACACCCRSCLEKWHKIPKGRKLTDREIRYLVALIIEWIKGEIN